LPVLFRRFGEKLFHRDVKFIIQGNQPVVYGKHRGINLIKAIGYIRKNNSVSGIEKRHKRKAKSSSEPLPQKLPKL